MKLSDDQRKRFWDKYEDLKFQTSQFNHQIDETRALFQNEMNISEDDVKSFLEKNRILYKNLDIIQSNLVLLVDSFKKHAAKK